MPTSREIAEKAVAMACAATSGFVKIQKLEPLVVSPAGLNDLRFQDVGIINDAQIEAFLETLAHMLPDIAGGIMKASISPGTVIGKIVNLVEDLLQNL